MVPIDLEISSAAKKVTTSHAEEQNFLDKKNNKPYKSKKAPPSGSGLIFLVYTN